MWDSSHTNIAHCFSAIYFIYVSPGGLNPICMSEMIFIVTYFLTLSSEIDFES